MRNNVDLPQPEGPTQDDELAVVDVEVDVAQHLRGAIALGQMFDAEVGHRVKRPT